MSTSISHQQNISITSNGIHDRKGITDDRFNETIIKHERTNGKSSKASSIKSPSSNASSIADLSERKKLPINKIRVGKTPSPNLKEVKSKIGSLSNANHKAGGGNVRIESKKLDFSDTAKPRIQAKNEGYEKRGGDKKIISTKLEWNVKSKIGSLENAEYKPGGGDKKIESVKLNFKNTAKPKVGSKDNMNHIPGGGDVKIVTKKLNIKAESKINSLHNVDHKPGGGDKKIFDDKTYLKQIQDTLERTSINSK